MNQHQDLTLDDDHIAEAQRIAQKILQAQPPQRTGQARRRRLTRKPIPPVDRQRTPDKLLKWATMDHDTLQRWVTDPNRGQMTDDAKQLCYRSMATQQGLTEEQAHAANHAAGMHQAFQTTIYDSVRYRLFSRKLAEATLNRQFPETDRQVSHYDISSEEPSIC